MDTSCFNHLSLIINSIAAFAALAAAIVAIIQSICAKKQFVKNMKEQERAINVSLLNERTTILSKVLDKSYDFSRAKAELLFDESISQKINDRDETSKLNKKYFAIYNEYMKSLKESMLDTIDEYNDFLACIEKYDSCEPTDIEYNSCREYLSRYPITKKWDCLIDEDAQTYSYIDIADAIENLNKKSKETHSDLVESIKEYIEKSIK